MPPRPAILFSSFHSGTDPLRQTWTRFREQLGPRGAASLTASTTPSVVVPPSVATTGRDESGIWRLLAPNNRELGRSSFLYSTFAAARRHVLQLQGAGSLAITTVPGPVGDSYGWFIVLGGAPVMTCTRWYSGAASARDAALAARVAFSTAIVGEAPLRTTPSGRRTNKVPRDGGSRAW